MTEYWRPYPVLMKTNYVGGASPPSSLEPPLAIHTANYDG